MFYIKKKNLNKLLGYGFKMETKFSYTYYEKDYNYGLVTISVDDIPFSEREYEQLYIDIYDGCNEFYFIKELHEMINKNIIEWRDEHDN